MYENCKIQGPYKSKSGAVKGRSYVKIVFPDGKIETTLYSRYLVEESLNRRLEKAESVDHIDCDKSNDTLSNLRVLSNKLHASLDAVRLKPQTFSCVWCGKKFFIGDRLKLQNIACYRLKSRAGPFCSKVCVGSYGKEIQLGRIKSIKKVVVLEYFKLKDEER